MTTVDRTYPLADFRFARANPDRVHVVSNNRSWVHVHDDCAWTVWRGDEPLRDFPTHTEAIRWAQSRAAIDKHPDATRYHFPEPMEAP